MTITELREEYCNFEGLFLEDKALIASTILLYIGASHLHALQQASDHIERHACDDFDEVGEFLSKINQGFTKPELLEICRELLA